MTYIHSLILYFASQRWTMFYDGSDYVYLRAARC
jgi:hypothetical protein